MLRATCPSLSRGSRYHDRYMQFPYRRSKGRYLMPLWAYRKSPMAHKKPEEYKDTWNARVGIEWHNRLRNRGAFRHWPFVQWHDDFIRKHKEVDSFGRTFSAKAKVRGGQVPLWNHYKEVGEHYGLPAAAPVAVLADIMVPYVGKTWSRSELVAHFNVVAAAGWPTVEALSQRAAELVEWNRAAHAVPSGFIQHATMLAEDVCRQATLAEFRRQRHESGVLRTREMERYFALPYHRGPAMPTTLDRFPGKFPVGRYLMMIDSPFHPLQFPDKLGAANRYPA